MNKFIKIALILGLFTTLFGCDLFFRKKNKHTEHPPQAAVSLQQPTIASTTPQVTTPWELNEGQLVIAGDLLMQQQRDLGQSADYKTKRAYLSQHMNITLNQADDVLELLGIED